MEEELVYGFMSDNTPIPIYEASEITGLSYDELRMHEGYVLVKYQIKESEHEKDNS